MTTDVIQLKLIEKILLSDPSELKDAYNYFLKNEYMNSFDDTKTIKSKTLKFDYMTGKNLAKSEFAGLWQKRKITDSVDFAESLRNKVQSRTFE